jgi:transposase InsO family protein
MPTAATANRSLISSGDRNSREIQLTNWSPWSYGWGPLQTVVSDNGTDLTSKAILRWADDYKVEWRYIAAGKTIQNTFAKSPA